MNALPSAASAQPWIALSDPDMSQAELDAVSGVLCSPRLSHGPMAAAFEQAFAHYLGRKYAVAVGSGTLGMMLALKAHGIGAGDEVITTANSWRETAHAIALVGATSRSNCWALRPAYELPKTQP